MFGKIYKVYHLPKVFYISRVLSYKPIHIYLFMGRHEMADPMGFSSGGRGREGQGEGYTKHWTCDLPPISDYFADRHKVSVDIFRNK